MDAEQRAFISNVPYQTRLALQVKVMEKCKKQTEREMTDDIRNWKVKSEKYRDLKKRILTARDIRYRLDENAQKEARKMSPVETWEDEDKIAPYRFVPKIPKIHENVNFVPNKENIDMRRSSISPAKPSTRSSRETPRPMLRLRSMSFTGLPSARSIPVLRRMLSFPETALNVPVNMTLGTPSKDNKPIVKCNINDLIAKHKEEKEASELKTRSFTPLLPDVHKLTSGHLAEPIESFKKETKGKTNRDIKLKTEKKRADATEKRIQAFVDELEELKQKQATERYHYRWPKLRSVLLVVQKFSTRRKIGVCDESPKLSYENEYNLNQRRDAVYFKF